MTHEEFLRREAENWQALWAITRGLDEGDWLVPGAAGEWNLKDVLAHIAAWQEETIRLLPEMARQVVAGIEEPFDYDIDAWNAAQYEARRDLSVAEVQKGLLAAREQLIAMLQRLPGEWLDGHEGMRNWAMYSTYAHYDEHLPDLRAWREGLQEGSSGG